MSGFEHTKEIQLPNAPTEMTSPESAVQMKTGFDAGNGAKNDIKPARTTRPKQESVFDKKVKSDSDWPEWRLNIGKAIDAPTVSIFMVVVTIWALFGDDIRLLGTSMDADSAFTGITIFCFVCFVIELVASSAFKPEYFLNFFFWLDLLATMSLLLDIPVIFQALIGQKQYPDTNEAVLVTGGASSAEAGKVAQAGRASRAGTRAGRLVRLVRIVKLYKQWQQKKEQERAGIEIEMSSEEEELQESRVGKRLSDLTTRRVIIGVLLMLFLLQLFEVDTYPAGDYTKLTMGGLPMLAIVAGEFPECSDSDSTTAACCIASPGFCDAVADYQTNTKGMYRLTIAGVDWSDHLDLYGEAKGLRADEYDVVTYNKNEDSTGDADAVATTFVFFDNLNESQLQAVLNMCRTVFVLVILAGGAMLFQKDADVLVLQPIERMVKKVRQISENPLMKHKVEEGDGEDQQFETKILENSIMKIASLLAVGFGDAGAEVIGENMKNGGALNPMVPGSKKVCIFGFCDIRQFTDATEVLQEGVMEFVNSIGKIVHMEVAMHGGSANKNIGDAFLLCWKFPAPVTLDDVNAVINGQLKSGSTYATIQGVADKSLAAFAICQAMLKKSPRLHQYTKHDGLNRRMPNYRVKLGYGLHVGWAIEGAIGSEYKVDASYLSPNVNMSARLEAATKQFGTPLLLSQDFVSILSPKASKYCRMIDKVTVKGSLVPMGLFTYDCNLNAIPDPSDAADPDTKPETLTHSTDLSVYGNEFEEHPDLVAMRGISLSFMSTFNEGVTAYLEGRWEVARDILSECVKANGPVPDGPSVCLLNVMQSMGGKCPDDWRGFRELTEK